MIIFVYLHFDCDQSHEVTSVIFYIWHHVSDSKMFQISGFLNGDCSICTLNHLNMLPVPSMFT
jgi:hypothetical protein